MSQKILHCTILILKENNYYNLTTKEELYIFIEELEANISLWFQSTNVNIYSNNDLKKYVVF